MKKLFDLIARFNATPPGRELLGEIREYTSPRDPHQGFPPRPSHGRLGEAGAWPVGGKDGLTVADIVQLAACGYDVRRQRRVFDDFKVMELVLAAIAGTERGGEWMGK